MKRNCDVCNKEYNADKRNIDRGWGLCCSKSCAAKKREKSKPGYNSKRVKENNIRRALWNENSNYVIRPSHTYAENQPFRGYSSEGYRIFGNWTFDEYDEPVYCTDLTDMEQHPFDLD